MHVDRFGPEDGEVIVWLHGAMVAGWMWTQQVEDLADHRSVVPDLPGFGASGAEPWHSLALTADEVADVIRTESGDGRAHVVGLSLGGLVGLQLAVRHPQAVRSLLVSGVPLGSLSPLLGAANRLLLWLYRRPWGASVVARALGMPDDESRQAFVDGAARSDPNALRRIHAELSGDPIPNLVGLRTPMLAVAGSKDTKPAQRFVSELAELAPTATGRIVDGVGHQWNAEQPALFGELVRAWTGGESLPPGLRATGSVE